MKILTARQQNILDAIRHYLVAHGRPPTRAELAQSLGFRSANAAEQHLRALVRKGYIELLPGSNRNIRLLEEPVQPSGLALVGRIAAGRPMLAQEHIETRYQIDPQLFQPHADYLLRVRGMSMRDAGILEDDLLAVHRTAEAASGQVVVARLNDELTVKRIEFDNGQLRLRPENPEFMAIEIDPVRDNLVIEGIVVGIIRNGRL